MADRKDYWEGVAGRGPKTVARPSGGARSVALRYGTLQSDHIIISSHPRPGLQDYIDHPPRPLCLDLDALCQSVQLLVYALNPQIGIPGRVEILLHQPAGGMFGTAADIGIMAEEIVELRNRINRILAEHTNQPIERIQEDSDRDFYLSADGAKEYGLVDEVLGTLKDEEAEKAAG